MTRLSVVSGAVAAVLLSGCTSLEERQIANGNFDYLQETTGKPLVIPGDIDQPSYQKDYSIPDVGQNAPADLVGENVKVVAPPLVLPTVSGTHIEEGNQNALIWFDQVDDSQPLNQAIWNAVTESLQARNAEIESQDMAANTLQSGWIEKVALNEEDTSWLDNAIDWISVSGEEQKVFYKFRFDLDVKPHGRSAALTVTQTARKVVSADTGEIIAAATDVEIARESEVNTLNSVVNEYDKHIRLIEAKRIKQIRSGLATEMGFDADGNPAFVVDSEYEITWTRLLLVLRKLGFNVKDLDQTNGLLFVKYGDSDGNWWDNLWSSDKASLPLDKKDYRIQVEEAGQKTTVTLLSEDNEPFSADKVSDIFSQFAAVMAEKNLDI